MRVLLALALASLAAADDIQVQTQRLDDPDGPTDWIRFGESSVIDGDRAAIGYGPGGKVFTYRWNGAAWTPEGEIANPVAPYNHFGVALALDGDVLVVGAPSADLAAPGAGAVFVYRWDGTTWNAEATLLAPGAFLNDELGRSVAIDGVHLLAGAPGHRLVTKPGNDHGAVYAWHWDGASWVITNKLSEATPRYDDWFGWDLDVDGTTAAVAELPGGEYDFGLSHRGESHVFEFDGQRWVHRAEHKAPQIDSKTYGSSIALDGGRYVVHDYHYGVWVYEGAGANWNQTDLLTPDAQGKVSTHLAMSDGCIYFGSWGSSWTGVQSDEFYRYEDVAGTWTKTREMHLAHPQEEHMTLVAVDGDLALAAGEGTGSIDWPGVAYAWDMSKSAVGASYCPQGTHHDGGPGNLSAFGSLVAADGDLTLAATQLTFDKLGIFLMSQSAGSTSIGQGTLCLGSPIVRVQAGQADSGPNSSLSVTFDFANLPQGQVFQPGATWYFQCWFRTNGSSTFTDALSLTWQ